MLSLFIHLTFVEYEAIKAVIFLSEYSLTCSDFICLVGMIPPST